jgi:superfamily II DNA or RNA helicase
MHSRLPAPGDVVWIRQRRWRVERASRHRSVVRLDVAAREERLTFLAPFDRPAGVSRPERRRHVRPPSALARLAHLVARAHSVRTLVSAVGADVAILPHQLEPALAVVEGARRVLIADEVGLGKTIQAGLVIAELCRRLPAARALVVVPAALADQWLDELARRFHLTAFSADRDGLDQFARAGARGENPWHRAGLWIASLDYLKQPHVLDAMPARPWDLVVFDEAHTACGESDRHAAAQSIAGRARHVLLLTATPHDGDAARFERLLALGRLPDEETPGPETRLPCSSAPCRSLIIFRRTRADVAAGVGRRVRWRGVTLSADETALLAALTAFERAVIAAAGLARRDAALLLLAVFRKRAVSTMSALALSLERRQAWIERPAGGATPDWIQPSLFSGGAATDDLGPDEPESLTGDVGLDPRQERAWLKRLRALSDAARRRESKIAQLVSLLRRSREPVAVFTEFRHSLDAVRRRIEAIRAVAVLHGGQTRGERTRELGRFLEGTASVLLATDVASAGLNLQHRARWVISLELPWNPARLEQRLGRVDRIGQTRPVHVTLLIARHDVEAAVLGRLARRTLAARQALGDDLLGGITPDAARVRTSVIAGVPLDEPAPRARVVPLCRRWTRLARAAARTLERRRALAAHWRAKDADHGRARCATLRSWPDGGRVEPDGGRVFRPGETLLIFSVPITDGAGSQLEEHVVAVRVPRGRAAGGTDRTAIEAARELALRTLTTRVARVRRWLLGRHVAETARDRALSEAIDLDEYPAEAQPGLFDRRDLRAFETARRAAAAVRDETDERRAERDRIADAEAGRPILALILTRP